MREVEFKPTFKAWREAARIVLADHLRPRDVIWKSTEDPQLEIGFTFAPNVPAEGVTQKQFSVSAQFIEKAKFVSAHRDPARWDLLYRLLYRNTHGEPELFHLSTDSDVSRFDSMFRSVRRDMHKMKAFVRFREIKTLDVDNDLAPESHFVAWYEPDHFIVPLVARFFAERFKVMNWSILTADECVHWDQTALKFSPGCVKSMAPASDDFETLWKTYYASIFNPARIKIGAMLKEFPVRYWKNLPEAELISGLIESAPARLQEFYANQPLRAEAYIPPKAESLSELEAGAKNCRACPLWEKATQVVFGEGPREAELIIIGEQPGDQEDLSGRPFQGPAGKLLDQALREAGLDRSQIYLTNAVKHFKWKPQGKTRLHQKPTSAEIGACKPWLNSELKLLNPKIILCLGVSAAQAVFGKSVLLKDLRGTVHSTPACAQTVVTAHPSSILRAQPETKKAEYDLLVSDLARVKAMLVSDGRFN